MCPQPKCAWPASRRGIAAFGRPKQTGTRQPRRKNYFPIGLASGGSKGLSSARTFREHPMPLLARTATPSPAEVAFWKRNPTGHAKNGANNQADIIDITQRLKRKRLKLPNKNKAGAPKGNRNARTSGRYAKETVESIRQLRVIVRTVVAEMNLHIACLKAETARKNMQTMEMLRAAGLPRRAIWLSEL
ncbi:MAG TPA: hypothetical protein VGM36_09875 [Rhizomicrobium sp.]